MSEDRQTLRITALPLADVARALAAAYGRRISEEDARLMTEVRERLSTYGNPPLGHVDRRKDR